MKPRDKKLADRLAAAERLVEGAATSAIPSDPVEFMGRYLTHPLGKHWAAVIRATYGRPIRDPEELAAFREVAGGVQPPTAGVGELVVVAGRSSGKTEAAAGVVAYESVVRGEEHMAHLPAGTPGTVMLVAGDMKQASVSFKYIRAMLERSADLNAHVLQINESATGGLITLRNGIEIRVFAMSVRAVRGHRVVCCVCDELGFWDTSAVAADQDHQVLAAIRGSMVPPSLAPRRRLIKISSPGAKAGELWESYAKYHGRPVGDVLVVHGPSWLWHPGLSKQYLDEQREKDPRDFAREYGAEFVEALSGWIEPNVVDDARAGRTADPLPKRDAVRYAAGIDLASVEDACALVIGHREPRASHESHLTERPRDEELVEVRRPNGEAALVRRGDLVRRPRDEEVFVVDGLWHWAPKKGKPLDLPATIAEIAAVCRSYGILDPWSDQWSHATVEPEFARYGVRLVKENASQSSKRKHYGELKVALYARRVSLPDHPILVRELKQLQERVSGDNHFIGAPPRAGFHDDTCSALAWCGAAVRARSSRGPAAASSSGWQDH